MPSIFDIFGEIGLKSDKLEAGLRQADARLQATDKQLDKVIATSNRLGDTSATVARRYEKLGEGIELQRKRLVDSAVAFEKGEINATKFGNAITSVDKQVAGLNSRLKDAAARATEIGETGLTHFQNQIGGAVGTGAGITGAQTAHGSIFDINRSRPFLGLGAAFQATGLRQYGLDEQVANLLVIAARESGIIKTETVATAAASAANAASQGVVATESAATAAATTVAAAAETKFSQVAAEAATAQGILLSESEGVAAAMTEASTVTTVFGATITALGTTLAAGVVAVAAAYKFFTGLREEAEKRLKFEESIAGAMNEQVAAAAKLNAERVSAQSDRQFNTYLQGTPLSALQTRRSDLEQQLAESQRQSSAEGERLKTLASIYGPGKKGDELTAQAKTIAKAAADELEETGKQLKGFDAKIYEREQESARKLKALHDQMYGQQTESFQQFTERIKNNYKQQEEAQKQATEAAKKANDEAKKQADELASRIKAANALILDIAISTTDNPYVKIFDQAQKSVEKLKEATKGLHIDISAAYAAIQADRANKDFKQQQEDRLGAFNLRDLARQFRAGKLDDLSTPEGFQKHVQDQLNAIGGINALTVNGQAVQSSFAQTYVDWYGKTRQGQLIAATANAPLTEFQQHIRDQAILQAVGNDPSKLNAGQRQIAAEAAEREAKRLEDQEKVAQERLNTEKELVTQLKVLNDSGGLKLVIENNAPDNAKVSTRPKGTATTNYYSKVD